MTARLDSFSVSTNARFRGSWVWPAKGWRCAAYLRPRRGYILTYVFTVLSLLMVSVSIGLLTSEIDAARWTIVAAFWVMLVVVPLAVIRFQRTLGRLTPIPVDRIRPLGRHLVVTEKGLILDTPHATRFLPWENVFWVPRAFSGPGVRHPTIDLVGAATEIIGDGRILRRRWPWRAVGEWPNSDDAQPARIRIDVATFLESPQYRRLLSVLRERCKSPATDAAPLRTDLPLPTVDEPGPDDWLAESGLGVRVAKRRFVRRAVVVGVILAITTVVSDVVISDSSTARTAGVMTILSVALITVRPIIRGLLRLVGLSTTRTRWVGCHLAVTPGGLLVTDRYGAQYLPWQTMRGVVPYPLDETTARVTGNPQVTTPHIVGEGTAWQHRLISPLRRIGPPSRDAADRRIVAIDPTIVIDPHKHSEIGRCVWKYRPDIAAALGFTSPFSRVASEPPKSVAASINVTCYGKLDPESPEGQSMSVIVPECGKVTVERAGGGSSVRVRGAGVPTVDIERTGPVRDENVPIGSADPADLRLTVDGIHVDLGFVVRDKFSRIPHQFVVVDGFGDILRFVSDNVHTHTRVMTLYRGTRDRPLPLTLRRQDNGRVDVTAPKEWTGSDAPTPGELALGLALAAALGTRTLNLYNVPSSLMNHALQGFAAPGGGA